MTEQVKRMFVALELPRRKVKAAFQTRSEAERFIKGMRLEHIVEDEPFNDIIWEWHGRTPKIMPASFLGPEGVKCPECGNMDCEECSPCEYCGEWDCSGDCYEAHEANCGCIDDYICDYCREAKREAIWDRAIEAYEDAQYERTGKYY